MIGIGRGRLKRAIEKELKRQLGREVNIQSNNIGDGQMGVEINKNVWG